MLEPEHFASPHLDELSGMTYLSYFMKVATSVTMISTANMHLLKEEDSPGYYSTLNWVKHQIPNARINNFRVRDDGRSWLCWDGSHDCEQRMAEALFWWRLSVQSKAGNAKTNEKSHMYKQKNQR